MVGKHTGDYGSWATALVRWCPVPTSVTPTPAPLHTLLHVPSVFLCVLLNNISTSSFWDILQRVVLCLGTQLGAAVATPSSVQLSFEHWKATAAERGFLNPWARLLLFYVYLTHCAYFPLYLLMMNFLVTWLLMCRITSATYCCCVAKYEIRVIREVFDTRESTAIVQQSTNWTGLRTILSGLQNRVKYHLLQHVYELRLQHKALINSLYCKCTKQKDWVILRVRM